MFKKFVFVSSVILGSFIFISCDDSSGSSGGSSCTPTTEICDGLDNDCDGVVDNGVDMECIKDATRVCGNDEGQCSTGLEACDNTCHWSGECTGEVAPTTEICDGLDNDCDGVVDEDLQQQCNTACGLGNEVCVNGEWQNCTAPQPTDEVCDGVDNDCNGQIDDGVGMECVKGSTRVCGTDVGACQTGTELCGDTCQWAGTCLGEIAPSTEVCDASGEDENCDGSSNEGCACNNGDTMECCGAEPVVCTGGTFPSCPPAPAETCNGEDDNCDGLIDNGLSVDNDEINNVCSQARMQPTVTEDSTYVISGNTIYTPDLSNDDVDYYIIPIEEVSDTIVCSTILLNTGEAGYECYDIYFNVTGPDGADVAFDVIAILPDDNDPTSICETEPSNRTFTSDASGYLGLSWEGRCASDDAWNFYVKVYSSTDSCEPYTFTVDFPYGTIQDHPCFE